MAKKKVRKPKPKTRTKSRSRETRRDDKLSREQVQGLLKNLRRIFGPKSKK